MGMEIRRASEARTEQSGYYMLTDGARAARPYQEEAIAAWKSNGWKGILAMATGTGKTLTSLLAAEAFLREYPGIRFIVIAAPFQHLADQWAEEFNETEFVPIRAYKSTERWKSDLAKARIIYKHLNKPIVLLTTYATLSRDVFISELADVSEETLLIADECHYLGTEGGQKFMELPIPFRLGLSATPERHFDDSGTAALLEYFDEVVYEFGMQEAIAEGFLTPYSYHPEFVELTPEEADKYAVLTERIGKAAAQAKNSSNTGDSEEVLKMLLIKRARVINNAANKLAWLKKKIMEQAETGLAHTLVYTGERLFPEVVKLLGAQLAIPVHSFTGRESATKRKALLEQFAAGDIKVLVAMRCLDEGVDVPATRTAYFLASSTNARQYVQRRGRVLRRAPGKEQAAVHDTIVIPPRSGLENDENERTAFASQFGRVAEFALLALNSSAVSRELLDIRLRNDLPMIKPEEKKGTAE